MSRDSDTTFKVKGQGHQAALLTAVFTHQAAAADAWESIHRGNLLLRCRLQARREALRRPQREERGEGIMWRPPPTTLHLSF